MMETLSDKRKELLEALCAVLNDKEEWRAKMKRMELISVDVAILELNLLLDELAGRELVE